LKGSLTCRKSAAWDRRLYFPSEGRHTEDFIALKNPKASAGVEPSRSNHANYYTTEAASGVTLPYRILNPLKYLADYRVHFVGCNILGLGEYGVGKAHAGSDSDMCEFVFSPMI
jgi:hypothetical protein